MGKSKDLASGAAYQDQTESDTRYVNVTGDTMTGALTVGGPITVNPDADSSLLLKSGGTNAMFLTANTGDELYIGANNEYAFRIKNDGTKDVAFDNGGRVTMPSQPSFGAYQASANYTNGSGWAKMISDGIRWNEGSHYSTANSRFTAPVAGVYSFTANVNSYGISDDYLFGVALYVNNSSHTMGNRFYSRGGSDLVASMSHTIKLSASDYVEVYNYSNDASHGYSGGTVWNTFSGYLVG